MVIFSKAHTKQTHSKTVKQLILNVSMDSTIDKDSYLETVQTPEFRQHLVANGWLHLILLIYLNALKERRVKTCYLILLSSMGIDSEWSSILIISGSLPHTHITTFQAKPNELWEVYSLGWKTKFFDSKVFACTFPPHYYWLIDSRTN